MPMGQANSAYSKNSSRTHFSSPGTRHARPAPAIQGPLSDQRFNELMNKAKAFFSAAEQEEGFQAAQRASELAAEQAKAQAEKHAANQARALAAKRAAKEAAEQAAAQAAAAAAAKAASKVEKTAKLAAARAARREKKKAIAEILSTMTLWDIKVKDLL